MNRALIFTFIGADRPGLIERLADVVAQHNGSWQDSRMVKLAGQFAGIAQITLPGADGEQLESALRNLQSEGLIVHVQSGNAEPGETRPHYRLNIIGNDRPGIVREVSRALKAQNINISEMSSGISSAPMSGDALFEAQVEAEIPAGVNVLELEERLDAIADALSIEIDLSPLSAET